MVAEILIIPDKADDAPFKSGARNIAKGFSAAGIKVRESVGVCESAGELRQAISAALSRSNIIAIIGGLGSDANCPVKEVISAGLDLPLEIDLNCLEAIRDYCARTGEDFLHNDNDEPLAFIPRGGKALYPSFGKIPGCIISSSSQHIVLLPESQQEISFMLGKYLTPFLSGLESASAVTHVIRAYGVGEGYAREKLNELLRAPNPAVTLQEDGNETLIRVSSYAQDGHDAASLCAPVLKEIARRMGDAAYGLDVDSIQSAAVGKMLKKDLGLAIAEAGTMGLLTRVISETAGGQEILRYSTVADDDEAKTSRLEANPKLLKKRGGVSEYAAIALASGARSKSGASIGVGITANASDFEDKKSFPGLVYIAVCDRDNVYVKKLVVGDGGAPDDVIIDAAVSRSLNMLRLFVDYLPGMYKGCIGLSGALEGKSCVTGRDSYEDDISGQNSGGDMEGSGKKVKKLVLVFAIMVFLGCGGYLGLYYYQSHSAKQQAEALQKLYEYDGLDGAAISAEYPSEYQSGFGSLWSINSDIAGFISVEGTQVSYPVVQAGDNEYYLRRDFYNNKNNHGIPFMDYRVDIKRPSENIVIYGHNMKDGQIFGELLKYKTLDFYKLHPTINFDTLYKKGEYRIFSVFITNVHESQGPVFPYHDFIDSASDDDFINYVKQLKVRSIIDTGVDVIPGDGLITLSTCTYEFDDARLVIAARRLREGEDPMDGAAAAAMNRQPLYPDIWYETFGGEKPDGVDNDTTVVTRPVNNMPAASGSVRPENSEPEDPRSNSEESVIMASIPAAMSAQELAAPDSLSVSTASAEAMAALSKAASEKAASEKAASEKAASEKAASEKAASEKAASEKAASEKAASEKAASEKAASEKAAAEEDAASAAGFALTAAKKAETAAEQVMASDFSDDAQVHLERALDSAVAAKSYSQDATKASSLAGTSAAKKSASNAAAYAARAEDAFEMAEQYYIELVEAEKAEADYLSESSQQTQSSQVQGTDSAGGNTSASGSGGKLTVLSGGKSVSGDALDIISKIVQNEMGTSFHPEALKAQAVAAYSYISFHSRNNATPTVIMSSSASSKVINAVSEVLEQAVYYNGKVAFTPYFATSAGSTTSSSSVWGGSYPYLVAVDSSIESTLSSFAFTTSFTRDKVESLISSKLGISPDGDPSEWFEVLSETDGGYNGDMSVCGRAKSSSGAKITGKLLREQVFNLRSACFTIDYDSSSDKFFFTTYGYGHGVGMSQNGANLYASLEGWSYIDILNHYYPGTDVQ